MMDWVQIIHTACIVALTVIVLRQQKQLHIYTARFKHQSSINKSQSDWNQTMQDGNKAQNDFNHSVRMILDTVIDENMDYPFPVPSDEQTIN